MDIQFLRQLLKGIGLHPDGIVIGFSEKRDHLTVIDLKSNRSGLLQDLFPELGIGENLQILPSDDRRGA